MTTSDEIDYRLLSKRVHVARKQYECAECGQPIDPGTPYLLTVALIDDEFGAIKRHYNENTCWLYWWRQTQ